MMKLKSPTAARSLETRLVETARNPGSSLPEQHAAFTELVQLTQHVVFGLAVSLLRDVVEAEDAAQDAFATAWHRLGQLRDPSAFAPWLKSIVARECSRRRRRALVPEGDASLVSVEADTTHVDYEHVVASALERLTAAERDVTALFYFLGYTQVQIARLLRLKPGTVGKRLHSARLRMRRELPVSVRAQFVRLTPSRTFSERVRRGLLDEYVGQYRFDRRPDHVVSIVREGDALISEAVGQRHSLVSLAEHSLATCQYDGEGRFGRNSRGEVTHFVYYEFGKRMGVARKIKA
jgi:RNA polymerase sigma factor (sigma-70 family)